MSIDVVMARVRDILEDKQAELGAEFDTIPANDAERRTFINDQTKALGAKWDAANAAARTAFIEEGLRTAQVEWQEKTAERRRVFIDNRLKGIDVRALIDEANGVTTIENRNHSPKGTRQRLLSIKEITGVDMFHNVDDGSVTCIRSIIQSLREIGYAYSTETKNEENGSKTLVVMLTAAPDSHFHSAEVA